MTEQSKCSFDDIVVGGKVKTRILGRDVIATVLEKRKLGNKTGEVCLEVMPFVDEFDPEGAAYIKSHATTWWQYVTSLEGIA